MPYLLRLQQVASVLSLSSSPSAHAPVVGYIAPAHTVFTPRHTGIGVLGASASDLCRTFCNCNRWHQLSPCLTHCIQLYLCNKHCAGTSIARCILPLVEYMRRHHQCPCTCACHGVHRAGISSVYAAPIQVLGYFAPAPVVYYALLRLQQVVSILSLSCPPSTLSRVVEYIAPAPAVLLHLRLSLCTSR